MAAEQEDTMSNELDAIELPALNAAQRAARGSTPSPRLVARLFIAAGAPLRVRLLRCLLRPLGTLGAAGVAAGAFAAFVQVRGGDGSNIDVEAVSRLSGRQVHELAHFVEQVEPRALQRFANLAAASPLATAAFSGSVLLLLVHRLQPAAAPR
jgi:hypothetical protein